MNDMAVKIAMIEKDIKHIGDDISDIKNLLKTQVERIDELDKMKYRFQGATLILSSGIIGLGIKVFFF